MWSDWWFSLCALESRNRSTDETGELNSTASQNFRPQHESSGGGSVLVGGWKCNKRKQARKEASANVDEWVCGKGWKERVEKRVIKLWSFSFFLSFFSFFLVIWKVASTMKSTIPITLVLVLYSFFFLSFFLGILKVASMMKIDDSNHPCACTL